MRESMVKVQVRQDGTAARKSKKLLIHELTWCVRYVEANQIWKLRDLEHRSMGNASAVQVESHPLECPPFWYHRDHTSVGHMRTTVDLQVMKRTLTGRQRNESSTCDC